MKIAVIGSGAVGKTLGGLLQAAHHELHYLVRSEYSILKSDGCFTLNFKEKSISLKISPIHIYNKAENIPKVDLVIIATKTTENHNLAALVKPCLTENTAILIVQNGIGNEEAIESLFPYHPILCGITSIGATRPQPGTVDIDFLGELRLAPYHHEAQSIIQNITETLRTVALAPKISLADNYKSIRWHKLIWNAAFNPLSIIFNHTTDVLSSQEPFKTVVLNLFEEIRQTAQSEGVSISNTFINSLLEQTQASTAYWPSMHYDYIQNKPLETEYILNNLIKIARNHNLVLPCLTLVQNNMQQLSK